MQRAAASPSSAPSTPEERPSKKQRLSNGSYNSTPASTPRSEVEVVAEALAAEEQKRSEAIEREGADRGETKWYLNFKDPQKPATQSPLRIVSAGYSTLDGNNATSSSADEDQEEDHTMPVSGRRSFGKFNRKIEVSFSN